MQIYFASSSEVSIPIAENLLNLGLVSGFISNPDKPIGRKMKVGPNGFAAWAQERNLVVFKSSDNLEIERMIDEKNIDLVLTCAFGKIIGQKLLSKPKFGWLNIHFSLLPRYRGAAPVQRAILNGDQITGVSIFKLDEGIDTGLILYQKELAIDPNSKSSDVIAALANIVNQDLPDLLKSPENMKFFEQKGEASFAPKIDKSENRVSWNSDAKTIFNQFRALDINGGVFTTFRGEKLHLMEIRISNLKLKPGQLEFTNEKFMAGTATNSIEILRVKAQGKKEMEARDWLNGARLKEGEFFE